MRSLPFFAVAVLLTSAFSGVDASAFTVDESAGNKTAAANFTDPDNKIPYPHLADDGRLSGNSQQQPVGNGGFSLGFTAAPSPSAEPDAFERAQQRMQQ